MNADLNTEFSMIFELDLDPIKVKLMHKESGEGWSRQEVDAVEVEYRRFLCLMKLYPHEQVAPLFDVDIFWHYHILDTMKYAVDCDQIFGYFLHHFPYAGLRGEDDEAAHRRVGARMQTLYEATFGESYIRQQGDAAAQAITAFSIPAAAAQVKTAFSIPATAAQLKTAFSIPATAAQLKTAFSIPATAAQLKTAFSIPATVTQLKTAFSIPATAAGANPAFAPASAMTLAQNDRFYLERPVLEKLA